MSTRIQLELSGKYSATQAFKNFDEDVKKSQRKCKDFADAGKSVLGEMSGVFSGQLNGAISSTIDILGEITKGGIWGVMAAVASQAIGYVVKRFTEAKEAAEKLKKEYDDAAKKIGSSAQSIQAEGAAALTELGNAAKAAADRVESLRKVYYAAQELAKQRSIAAGGTGDEIDNAVRIQKRADAEEDAARRIEDAKKRVVEAEKNERRVLRATVNARTAKRSGVEVDIDKAEKALADAQKASEDARRELAAANAHAEAVEAANQADVYKAENEVAAKKREAEKKLAEERAKEEEKAAEEAEKARIARIDAETKAAEIQKRQHAEWLRERAASFKEQVETAKKAAEEWEKSAEKMRGKTFKDWMAEESNGGRSADAAARRFARANAESDRRASRIRMNARHGWASSSDREWLGKYDAWKAAQDPSNNPVLKSVNDLEAKRAAAVEDIAAFVKKIGEDIGTAISVG